MMSSFNFEVVIPFYTTAHEVRQRARCNNCGVKGNNTYQIVYTGSSDVAMDGTGVRSATGGLKDSIQRTATTHWKPKFYIKSGTKNGTQI